MEPINILLFLLIRSDVMVCMVLAIKWRSLNTGKKEDFIAPVNSLLFCIWGIAGLSDLLIIFAKQFSLTSEYGLFYAISHGLFTLVCWTYLFFIFGKVNHGK